MDKNQLRARILKEIELPVIPPREYSAAEFGLIPDSGEIQTRQLQGAMDQISEAGGGRLVLPAGVYRTGALWLKDQVELHLAEPGTVLSFVNEDQARHYPLVLSHWEATPCYNFSALLYACDGHDLAVTGSGTLDGGADHAHWWDWHHQVEDAWSKDKPDLQLQDRSLLRQMNQDGVPVEERIFGEGHYLRPNFVQPIRCERVLLQGITLKNSPMWQLNPVMCRSLIVDGVTLSSHGANNDGCDPESCDGVWIKNCRFDTGDDCISLKSGRDRDGRIANVPCQNVVIENNEFADGHGGIALGSEMSGGIRCVAALNNRFSSPNLTYALRLKTNARRGGVVEEVILADSVMDHVNGAAVHGTMLYEDGRNGEDLPVFRNLLIENIEAHGGDYGVFLEAFEEVPITGLVLRNIRIDGVTEPMHSLNWKNPVIEEVSINGKSYPRPGSACIQGVPVRGKTVRAYAESCGVKEQYRFLWQASGDGMFWEDQQTGEEDTVPEAAAFLRVVAFDEQNNQAVSRSYRVLADTDSGDDKQDARRRLICRGLLSESDHTPDEQRITRETLAGMLLPFRKDAAFSSAQEGMRGDCPDCEPEGMRRSCPDREAAVRLAIRYGLLAAMPNGEPAPERGITRQEMATVAMQACGVNYRNASSTMPVCTDVDDVSNNYGTNAARALYFGFMTLDAAGRFLPGKELTMGEAIEILNRVADFAHL